MTEGWNYVVTNDAMRVVRNQKAPDRDRAALHDPDEPLDGLDEFERRHPIATTGWRRPKAVSLERDELVFEWPDDVVAHAKTLASSVQPFPGGKWDRWRHHRRQLMCFGDPDVYPGRPMLFRFAKLHEATPSEIRKFAATYGAIEESMINGRMAWPPHDGREPSLLPDRQFLRDWSWTSTVYDRALNLAALPSSDKRDEELSDWVSLLLDSAGVVQFLSFEGGHARVRHASGGLEGGLAVELLATVAKQGLRRCDECGGEIEPRGRRYCRSCRDDGVADKRAHKTWRAKHRSGPEGQTQT
jgi:hypothetical protein